MRLLLEFCCYAYGVSLRFYPRELQNAFGREIRELFRQQTSDAWAQQGWSGLAPVLWCAAKEFFSEAVVFRVGSPEVIAGASSLVCTSAMFGCLLWALGNPLAVKAVGDRLHQILWDGGRPAVSNPRHAARRAAPDQASVR